MTKETSTEIKSRLSSTQLNGMPNSLHLLPTMPMCSNSRVLNSYFSSSLMSKIRDIYNMEEDEEERVVIVNKELEGKFVYLGDYLSNHR